MNEKENFERILNDLIETTDEESEVATQVKLALDRLKKNPSIFCGNPNSDFFYEDPILTNALFYYLKSKEIQIVDASGDSKSIGNNRKIEFIWAGINAFIKYGHESYRKLFERNPTDSIRLNKDTLHIALIGDAGYNNQVQSKVLKKIKERHKEEPFDYLIHLGDIYFAGGEKAVLKHFLAPFREVGAEVLALLGNHELYKGGESFNLLIDVLRQPGRYFAIENEHWCIACLDTSLPSKSFHRLDGELDIKQLKWLKELINNSKGKGLILMSHHYIISGWGGISPKLKKQIEQLSPDIFSWYWGHEHSCATYSKDANLGFYGACVGNGAYSEKKSKPKYKPVPQWSADGYCNCFGVQTKDWQHGYLELTITPTSIYEIYHLEDTTYSRELHRSE